MDSTHCPNPLSGFLVSISLSPLHPGIFIGCYFHYAAADCPKFDTQVWCRSLYDEYTPVCTHDLMSSRVLRGTFRRWYTPQANQSLFRQTRACTRCTRCSSVPLLPRRLHSLGSAPWNFLVQSPLLGRSR